MCSHVQFLFIQLPLGKFFLLPVKQFLWSAVSSVTSTGLRYHNIQRAPKPTVHCFFKAIVMFGLVKVDLPDICELIKKFFSVLFNPVWLSCRLQSAQRCHGWNGEGLWKAAPGIFPGATHSSTRLPRQPHVTHWSYVNGASVLPSLLDVGHRPTLRATIK